MGSNTSREKHLRDSESKKMSSAMVASKLSPPSSLSLCFAASGKLSEIQEIYKLLLAEIESYELDHGFSPSISTSAYILRNIIKSLAVSSSTDCILTGVEENTRKVVFKKMG